MNAPIDGIVPTLRAGLEAKRERLLRRPIVARIEQHLVPCTEGV
jgi:hypothetical protein